MEVLRYEALGMVRARGQPVGPSGSAGGVVAQARLQGVLDDMAAHFSDPQLTVEAVAHRQGISARYLQRLMATTGRTYTTVVNEMRLQKAFKDLTARGRDTRTVQDIALQAGFSDLSYFGRLFRARYGDSPHGVRALRKSSDKPAQVRATTKRVAP